MCSCLGSVLFAFALVLTSLPAWIIVRINLCIAGCCPSYLPTVHSSTKRIISWAWWISCKICCCILRIRTDGVKEMNESLVANDGKPRGIIINHLSFMDALVLMTLFTGRVASNVKALASAHLFAMPILGGIGTGAGHFQIPFKSLKTKKAKPGEEAGGSVADMSVDKDGATKAVEGFTDWIRTGHIGSWFPEGRLNPNPQVVQIFRAGGFKPVVEVDCMIWCVVYAGFEVFWHRKAVVGGAPSNVRCSCFKLCDSSHDLIKELAKGEDIDDKQKMLLIANYAHDLFQKKRDEFTADPWVSKLPPLKTTENEKGVPLTEKAGSQAS